MTNLQYKSRSRGADHSTSVDRRRGDGCPAGALHELRLALRARHAGHWATAKSKVSRWLRWGAVEAQTLWAVEKRKPPWAVAAQTLCAIEEQRQPSCLGRCAGVRLGVEETLSKSRSRNLGLPWSGEKLQVRRWSSPAAEGTAERVGCVASRCWHVEETQRVG